MPERIYKKFQNEVKKYLSAAEREAQDKYCTLWGNRLAGVRHVRGEIYTKVLSTPFAMIFCSLSLLIWVATYYLDAKKRAIVVAQGCSMVCDAYVLYLHLSFGCSSIPESKIVYMVVRMQMCDKCMKEICVVQLANWKDVRLVMNRAVVKQHERLLRQNKPETALDNREARMQALKANDFAAYQAMLKATQGDAAALDDRCVACCFLFSVLHAAYAHKSSMPAHMSMPAQILRTETMVLIYG